MTVADCIPFVPQKLPMITSFDKLAWLLEADRGPIQMAALDVVGVVRGI